VLPILIAPTHFRRINLSAQLNGLHHFVHPATADHKTAFVIQNLPDRAVPPSLRQTSYTVVKQARQLYGKRHVLQHLVVDFEACLEVATWEESAADSAQQAQSSGEVKASEWSDGRAVIAPHLLPNLVNTSVRYHFR
jgi:hypothetical protein